MRWFEYEICVPFGNPQYDVGLGGPHDMDVKTPPNTPITALLAGTVVDIGEPTWGMVIGVKLDQPYKGIPYMAYLHLAAVNVRLNDHIVPDQLIAWSGGCNTPEQYAGTTNPTGRNFLNTPTMSSQSQTGIAIMRGPVYGSGSGWEAFPPVDWSLDPTQIILDARNNGGQDVPVAIDLNTPHLSDYFTLVNGNQWQRKNAPGNKMIILHGDMLKYYQTNGCVPYCGFSSAGLPLSSELKIETFGPDFSKLAGSGITVQYFERAVWIYDPHHIIDQPLGAGTVYPLHLYQMPGQDPEVTKLLTQVTNMQAQLATQQATITAQEAQIAQLQTQQTSEPDPIAAIHAVQAAVAPFK